MKILAISGSTRKQSVNNSILQFLQLNSETDFQIFESIDRLPHFNPDEDRNPPKSVLEFRNAIQDAEAVLFCSPEYVFSLPGSLKNAIEWTVSTTVFTDKKVGIIIAASDGSKAMESLVLIMKTMQAVVNDDAVLKISTARAKIGEKGEIIDEETRNKLLGFMRFLT